LKLLNKEVDITISNSGPSWHYWVLFIFLSVGPQVLSSNPIKTASSQRQQQNCTRTSII